MSAASTIHVINLQHLYISATLQNHASIEKTAISKLALGFHYAWPISLACASSNKSGKRDRELFIALQHLTIRSSRTDRARDLNTSFKAISLVCRHCTKYAMHATTSRPVGLHEA